MKWKGNENDRAGIIKNFIREGAESLHRDKPSGAAERVVGEAGRQGAKTESSKSNPRDRDSGNQGNGDRASVASRAHGVIQLVKGLSKDQLRNLGIDSGEIRFMVMHKGIPDWSPLKNGVLITGRAYQTSSSQNQLSQSHGQSSPEQALATQTESEQADLNKLSQALNKLISERPDLLKSKPAPCLSLLLRDLKSD